MNGKFEEKFLGDLPLVSIIIPSFNQGDFIERTLLSILKQDYPNTEVVVIDGGSTDQTVEILKRYSNNVRWLSEKDEGYADAVNKGLDLVRGSIVGIQSSDDYYNQHAIREAVELLIRYPEAALVTGKRIHLDCNNQVTMRSNSISPRWIDHWDFLEWTVFPAQDCTFARRDAIETVQGLKKEVDYCADLDLWMRILSLRPGIIADRFWSFRQHHEDQRDAKQREVFAKDARRSVELWLESTSFPKELEPFRLKIKAFGVLRETYYYYHTGLVPEAKESLAEALRLYAPTYEIGPCQRYCIELGVRPSLSYRFTRGIRGLLKLLPKSIKDKGLITKNRPARLIDQGFNHSSQENPFWYVN